MEYTDEMKWQDFIYNYMETGWFDIESRPKTFIAMRQFWEKVPEDTLDQLQDVLVFAPSPGMWARVYPYSPSGRIVLYLSPFLEDQPQEEVDFTVAHEFAHVVLKHTGITTIPTGITKHEDAPDEIAADRLAESWGLRKFQPDTRRQFSS